MTSQYGPTATAYFAFKSMIFFPSKAEALNGLIAYLEASNPQSPLLNEAKRFIDDASELEFDFNRMCIGPYKLLVAPYEGIYRSGNHVMNTDDAAVTSAFTLTSGTLSDQTLAKAPPKG